MSNGTVEIRGFETEGRDVTNFPGPTFRDQLFRDLETYRSETTNQ